VKLTGSLALPGFLLSGFLLAILGALLPAWSYYLNPRYSPSGNFFFALGTGIIIAGLLMRKVLARVRVAVLLTVSCVLAWAALLFLALVGPPAPEGWRLLGWVVIGLAAGLLNAALFEAIRPVYQSDPAGTVNLAGILYGIGCLGSALLVAGTFYLYSVTTILVLIAALPGFFAALYYRRYGSEHQIVSQPAAAEVFRDFLSPGAVMFALLLFFQCGNEWSLAGWLPLYLIRHLGMSPEGAVWMLAVYWLALLVGRVVAIYLLDRVRHSRLLMAGAGAALFGCVLLISTGNRFGAAVGTIFCGAGFAPIYPLVVERIGRRFPYYHPGVFNSIFSVALAGGMLAPGIIGWLADSLGVWVVMGLPVLGTLMVVILLLLIWLESKVTGR
jgi:FHS family glucose/mannose:H+ symporter-like MFS transporter